MKKIVPFILISFSLSAQIKGVVVDENNKPIPYVNIWIENENIGSTSEDDGSFKIDYNYFKYASNYITKRNNRWGKKTLLYFDFNGDGRKDISYIDASNGDEFGSYNTTTLSGCRSTVKTVFIREGNQFVEKDYFQFDPYAKSILPILLGRWK